MYFCMYFGVCIHMCLCANLCTCFVSIHHLSLFILHVSLLVSARILFCICMYPCSYMHVPLLVSARIPFSICMCPDKYRRLSMLTMPHICTFPSLHLHLSLYLLVPCLYLHLQFNAHSAKHWPSSLRLAKSHTPTPTHKHQPTQTVSNTHTHTHTHTA